MSTPAVWLRDFVNSISKEVAPFGRTSPLNCHYVQEDGVWEVSVFFEPIEVWGGPEDGSVKQIPFGVKISKLLDLFQSVSSCSWQTSQLDAEDDLGAHLAIEGIYKGRSIWLRILAEVPQRLKDQPAIATTPVTHEDLW